jgi:hypothetical protein
MAGGSTRRRASFCEGAILLEPVCILVFMEAARVIRL